MATLVAPLIAALANDRAPRDALADPAKLIKLLRSLRVGVATIEFASRWELEAAGMVLDWSSFPPRPAAGVLSRAPVGARAPQVLAALRALGRGKALPAASVTGPVTATAEVAAASAPAPGVAMERRTDARHVALAAARALCEAGAKLVWIVEDSEWAPRDAAPLQPLVAAIRAAGAIPALHLSGEADAWLEPVKRLRQAVPCFDPARSPALARALTARPFGVLAAPGERPHPLAKEAVLVAHDGELAGRVGADGLRDAVKALRP